LIVLTDGKSNDDAAFAAKKDRKKIEGDIRQQVKEEIKSKDDRVKEQGVNNNSLYNSFVENSTKERRSRKVKEEETREKSRSLKGGGSGRLKRGRSLVVSRSGNMGSPSRSPSRSGSPTGGRSDDNRSRSGISPPQSESRSPNSSPRRYSRSRRSRSGSRRSRSPLESGSRTHPRPSEAKGDRENPAPTSCIGVFGLNFKTTDADLHRAFSKFGSIEKVNVVLDGPSKRSRGFAFLYFETVAMAKEAKEEMDGSEIDGFQIRVDYSITDSAHKPTPGVYFHHGKATRPSVRGRPEFRGRGDFFRGRGELRGRGRGGWRGGRQEGGYPPPGPPRYHGEDRYYDQRLPPPRYYDRGDYRGYDKYERDYYDRVPSRQYPASTRDYPSSSRDYDRYYDTRDRYLDERERYYEDRYGERYGPPSRAYYDRPPASRRDYHDPREYERYERYPLHQSSDYSSRRRSRSPLPPTRRGY